MNRITAFFGAMLLVFGISVISAGAASADTQVPSCSGVDTTTGTGNCADVKSSSAYAEDTGSSYAAVSTHGKVLVRYNMASGIKVTKTDTSKGCHYVSKPSQVKSTYRCIKAKRGFHFTNSGVTTGGSLKKWQDYVGNPHSSTPNAAWIRFIKRSGQWYKAGSNTGAGNCGNKVWFSGPKPALLASQVILVKSWANWSFTGHVSVKASASATATSKSWCTGNGTYASATANGAGYANASASASYTVKGLSQIKAWISGKRAQLKQQYSLQVDAQASANAKTDAVASASTKVSCSNTPPPTPGPQLLEMDTVNDVLINNSRTISVTGSVVPNHSATLFCAAKNGGSITAGKTQTVSGTFTTQVTYKAPSEVPVANGDIAAGHDRVDCVLTQDDGQHDSKTTNQFVIKQPVADPL